MLDDRSSSEQQRPISSWEGDPRSASGGRHEAVTEGEICIVSELVLRGTDVLVSTRDVARPHVRALTDAPTDTQPLDAASLANAFLNLPDGVVIVDTTGTVVWANRSAERIFERSLDDWYGRSGLDLVHPDDLELVLRSLSTVVAREVGTPIDIRIRAASGWRLAEVVGAPVRWWGEDAVMMCLRDLTQRRRYEVAQGSEDRFRSLVHNAASVIMLVSPSGEILSASGALTRQLGHDPELLHRRPFRELVASADRGTFTAMLETARRGSTSTRPATARIGLLRHDGGTAVPFDVSVVNLLDDPTVEGFVVSAIDATAHVRAQHDVSEALSLVTATLESTADGILVMNTEGTVTGFNRRFTEIWNIPDEVTVSRVGASALAFAVDQLAEPEAFMARAQELSSQPEHELFDTLTFKDGRVIERTSRPQRVEGEIVGRVLSFRDVTDRSRLEDELEYRAFHDPLTGLANKALFQDRLDHALARLHHTGTMLAVLFVDLDDFKTVNDSLGHGAGDNLLGRVATTLVECLRPLDTAARMGGDEFAILIEDVSSRDSVMSLARRLLERLRRPVRLEGKTVSAAGSIGIAFAEVGVTSEQLLRNADIAMYRAKDGGKDRFEVYRDEMHAMVLARLEHEDELRRAIVSGALVAHYQPIMDLRTNRLIGFETLTRWLHPTRGLIDPRYFIPLAEELGLIGQIDAFALRSACRQSRRWQDDGLAGPELVMSVNVSAGQLADPSLAPKLRLQLAESKLNPRSLIVEITESAMLADSDVCTLNLQSLRAHGVRFALDDFGTGYSTFSHLDRLHIDIVKIDKSFVHSLGGTNDRRGMVAAMVQLGQTLGYQVIAEGVENAAQARSLRTLGCRLAQGYHLGPPLDVDGATSLLEVEARGSRVIGRSLGTSCGETA
jgi:diguanylate cyclase (GGDEF)-like protein/PAS domain S-box-containing protein